MHKFLISKPFFTEIDRGRILLKDKKNMSQFPILRGESVSESGIFSGTAYLVCNQDDLKRDWSSDAIAVLDDELEEYFNNNPQALADLFSKVHVVISEFGESIGQFALSAAENSAIGVIGIRDAADVLETGMHIRIEAIENQCDIYFID